MTQIVQLLLTFGLVALASMSHNFIIEQSSQCPQILNSTCLHSSLPIIIELNTTNVTKCCAACVANPQCSSWTVNPEQKQCHIRATFKTPNKGKCTSGKVRDVPPKNTKNVLLIVIDDLRPQLGCYNISVCGAKMHTPNIDALSRRALTFKHAYNQYSVCSPSRNSFMSGRRPDTTLTWNFKDSFRTAPGAENWIAFPQYFKVHGYNTTGCGKTYHSGHPPKFDQPYSWTENVPYVGYNQGLGFCGKHGACVIAANDTQHRTDEGLAARAIELLTSHKTHNITPFFLAVGFIRPHVDYSAPQEFWDLYPEDKVELPKHKTAPSTSPKVAWVDGRYLDHESADVGPNYHFNASIPVKDSVSKFWRRGYYAAVSYVDSNIGKVLNALEDLGFANDTVVGLLADHGYQIGEHSMWEKYTNWELATRVPFMLAVPWKPNSHGKVTNALVENVDMYPTLVAAAGLPPPKQNCTGCIEGFDATPLLDNPNREWKRAVFSQYARCDLDSTSGYYKRCSGTERNKFQVMGYSVRTSRWRYTEWFKFNTTTLKADFNRTIATELYDHAGDTGGNFDEYDQVNVASDPANAKVVKEHAQIVRDGWQKQLPSEQIFSVQ